MNTPSIMSSSPSKRPRLSLKTRASPAPETIVMTSTSAMANVDTSSPTAFNTLTNAYAAAIEQSSPRTSIPTTSIYNPMKSSNPAARTNLRLVTNAGSQENLKFPSQLNRSPGPFTTMYPDTPTPYSELTPITAHPDHHSMATTPFTFTPPQSAHPSDDPMAPVFSFTVQKVDTISPKSPKTPRSARRRFPTGHSWHTAPYTHPRSLHSILRNSPLPPGSTITPVSPSRVSKRIAERAARAAKFADPLTQTITTQTYIKSHIDLLAEEASPFTPTDPEKATLETLDLTLAYSGDETRDGGQTPGPFEEMRRRMAGLGAESDPETPSTRKRKRKEKKRQWIWTIGSTEEDAEKAGETPITAIRRGNTPAQNTGMDTDTESCAETTDTESCADTEMVDRPMTSHSF